MLVENQNPCWVFDKIITASGKSYKLCRLTNICALPEYTTFMMKHRLRLCRQERFDVTITTFRGALISLPHCASFKVGPSCLPVLG